MPRTSLGLIGRKRVDRYLDRLYRALQFRLRERQQPPGADDRNRTPTAFIVYPA